MPFKQPTKQQQRINDGIAAWCDAEGIAYSRQLLMVPGSKVKPAWSAIQFDLGDTTVWIGEESVAVHDAKCVLQVPYHLAESGAVVVSTVTMKLEHG